MRFWITKNSESSIREQLVEQVILGILSEDLPRGQKLPSVRALARRHRIHSNTVGAAYQYLKQEGWLEARRGSGLYVRRFDPQAGEAGLDPLLRSVLAAAKSQGYEPADVLQRLDRLVRPRGYEHILIIEPEAAMREILHIEIAPEVPVSVDTSERYDGRSAKDLKGTLLVALPMQARKLRRELLPGVDCFALRLRSVKGSLEESAKPESNVVVTIVSGSVQVRRAAHTMLLAVGLAPESLCEIDAASEGWKDRLTAGSFVVTDVATASELPSFCLLNVFRLIADSSIAELRQCCGNRNSSE